MTVKAAVAGASGYAGGELLRLLLGHPDIDLGLVAAGSAAGRRIGDVHPNLPALADVEFVSAEPDGLSAFDLVFLALPHGQSAALASELPPDQPIVDLGADHRLCDPAAWRQYYGSEAADPWTYGMPELAGQRSVIGGSLRVANPGCYPTAVTLAAAPLLAAGLVNGDDVVVVAASGTSGAGRGGSSSLPGAEVMASLSVYKAAGVHQHTPEMEQALSAAAGRPTTVCFTPILAPMPRGILATVSMPVTDGVTTEMLRSTLGAAYSNEPFVHLLDEGRWPRTGDVLGGNSAQLQAAVDQHAGRAVVVSAIDNLGKGAAGQAIQNANLVLGFAESAGLTADGVAP